MLVERALRSQLEPTMRIYLVRDHHVTVTTTVPTPVPADTIVLQSIKNLDARRFPTSRLIAIWNALPGATPIRRFTDRKAAVKRVWTAFEGLPLASSRANSKQFLLITLLQRPAGAAMDELTTATGWQPHSVRGVLSGVLKKKLGLKVISAREEDRRIYRIQA